MTFKRTINYYAIVVIGFIFNLIGPSVYAQFRQLHVESGENDARKMSFYLPSEGYVAFQDFVGFTTDSGKTFIQKKITLTNVDYNNNSVNITFGFSIQGVKAFDKNRIIAYGHYGLVPAILYSSDQGNTFKVVYTNQFGTIPNSSITDMIFPQNTSTGYAVDVDRVLKTTDGGLTWSVCKTLAGNSFTELVAINDSQVFAVGKQLLKTSDSGGIWSAITLPSGTTLSAAFFLTLSKGWLSTTDGNNYSTTDGSTWIKQSSNLTLLKCKKLKFVNDSTGYALSDNYEVYQTSNSGKLWQRLARDNNYSYLGYTLYDLQLLGNYLWVAGGHGYLALSTNGGGIPIPKPIFTIDTAGVYISNTVKLNNASKSGYAYQWSQNGTVISTAYNTTYTHDIYRLKDTIQLVVKNNSYADTLVQYIGFNAPTVISAFTPTTGATGTSITITGINFQSATSVSIGGVRASSFTIVSPTTIRAIVGSGASGKITVYTPVGFGSLNGFVYIPPPVVSSFSPVTAKAGATITINGTNFTGVTGVSFGGKAATSYTVISPTQITAQVGSGLSGSISVSTSAGSSSLPGFAMIPVLASFTPASGTNGTVIKITGTGLDQVQSVSVAGTNVKSFVIDSATSITAVISQSGSGNVQVNAAAGVDAKATFTYYNPPVITSFSPASGPVATTVTINGANFSTTLANNIVWFGAVKATVLTATANIITVKVPAGNSYQPITVQSNHLTAYAKTVFLVTIPGNNIIAKNSFTSSNGFKDVGSAAKFMDIDGDGKPDIIGFNDASKLFSVFRNTSTVGSVGFVPNDIPNTANMGGPFYVTDIDGDGLADLIVPIYSKLYIYLNQSTPGNIKFSSEIITTIASAYFSIVDLDGDGKPDIVTSNGIYRNKS